MVNYHHDKIKHRINAENEARQYFNTVYPKLIPIIKEWTGKKVKLKNGDTSKPFRDAVNAVITNIPNVLAWLEVSDYSGYLHIRVGTHDKGVYLFKVNAPFWDNQGVMGEAENPPEIEPMLNVEAEINKFIEYEEKKKELEKFKDTIWYGCFR